jgi:DNA-binding CsgD family transcriptional regulator
VPKDYGARIIELVGLIAKQQEEGQVLLILQEAVKAMRGEAGVFCSFVRGDEGTESYRFLVACDPAWCSVYQEQNWFVSDPALIYAATRSEPIRKEQLPVTSRAQRELMDSAANFGFVGGGVFPAPSGGRVSRIGVLILGSSDPAYLQGEDFEGARMYGRVLSMELNEWWIRKIRQDIIATSNLTQEDIALLAFEKRGMKSKEIARELETTASSIDSRFQRLNAKLHTVSRAESAKIAAENGVI